MRLEWNWPLCWPNLYTQLVENLFTLSMYRAMLEDLVSRFVYAFWIFAIKATSRVVGGFHKFLPISVEIWKCYAYSCYLNLLMNSL